MRAEIDRLSAINKNRRLINNLMGDEEKEDMCAKAKKKEAELIGVLKGTKPVYIKLSKDE